MRRWIGHNRGTRTITFAPAVASASYDSLTLHAGGGFARTYPVASDTRFIPSLPLDCTTMRDRACSETGAGEHGAAFTTYGNDARPWVGRGGAGPTYRTQAGVEVTVRQDPEYGSGYLNQTASAKLRRTFRGPDRRGRIRRGEPWGRRPSVGQGDRHVPPVTRARPGGCR